MPNRLKFRTALASAGLTQRAWAAQNNIGEPLLSLVLSARRKSRRISKLIEDFTAKQLSALSKEVTEAA
jgi:hypothetical protein